MEVVRYDRSGKYFLEPVGFPMLQRQHVKVRAAALYALWAEASRDGKIFLGVPGGQAFDRMVSAERLRREHSAGGGRSRSRETRQANG